MFRDFFILEKILNIGRKLIPKPVFIFFQPWYHGILALSGAVAFSFPSHKIKVIGVTGTKGKSTTVYLITKFLEEAGYKVAAIGSLGYKIGDKEWPNNLKMTMPGRWKIQKFLAQAIKAGCHFAVLEVTSEGIKQKRHFGIKFDAAVFTNLEKEHIESHGSFEKYYKAKQELFKKTKNIHILNADSSYFDLFSKFSSKKKFFYSLKNDFKFITNLQGEFNRLNILAAAQAAKSYGVSHEIIQKALDKIKNIPGRLEFIEAGQDFKIVVDYAHTPGSLEAVYKTLKENLKFKGLKLICVLGAAGGGRDRWKRPIFGQLAENYCDRIILTDEDPYDENPLSILKEIEIGFSKSEILNPTAIPGSATETRLRTGPSPSREPSTSKSEIILDRRGAIKKALTLAQKNDIVVITGKGSENSIAVTRGKKIPWSDKNVILEELKSLT